MTHTKNAFLLITLFLSFACATVKSGHYVMIKPTDTIDTLAKEFNVPKEKIVAVNKDKHIKAGEWVFIPLKRGVLDHDQDMEAHPFDPGHLLQTGEFLWPVPSSNKMSSGFGSRWGKKHEGVDIPGRVGSHIVAAAEGVVVYSGDEIGGYGNITVIAHKDGYFSVYAHAKVNFTKQGQRVYRGQVIAQIGLTGRTYGPHLHFEVRKNGQAIDPTSFLAVN
ncbi:MAG: LysM peptidoglycan-binding domain-containing M23 family metallopeptidase [Bacteriovorax sp.]|nr:LysM peptidoglycan-binding domain-containing M23 family metallopeptidase [Bacteriovorax sp.]